MVIPRPHDPLSVGFHDKLQFAQGSRVISIIVGDPDDRQHPEFRLQVIPLHVNMVGSRGMPSFE
jgi:hypothetical protein